MVKNRTRTIITAVGIAMAAALFCAVITLGASILTYLIDLQIAVGGDYHVSRTVISSEESERIQANEAVDSAAQARILGMINLYGQEMGPNSGMLKAADENYFTAMPGFDHIEGRLPQSSGELLIGEYLLHVMQAKGHAIELGSQVTLPVTPYVGDMGQGDPSGEDFSITATIVGVLPFDYDITLPHEKGSYSHIYIGLDENTPQELYCDLFLKAPNPWNARDLAVKIDSQANYSLLQYYGLAEAGNVTFVIWGVVTAIIAIVMVGTVSLISNAFSISVAQRTQEFGLLSSVGATRKQIRQSVNFEAGVLCLMGIPAGLLLGFFAARVLLNTSADTVESMLAVQKAGVTICAVVNPIALLATAAVSSGTVFLSSWLPSARAAKITPITAIRRETEYQPDRKIQKTERRWWNPARISSNLAGKYYRTSRKKYRPIVASLAISVVLFLVASSVSSSLQYVSNSFDMENSDFVVFYHGQDEALFNGIRQHESIEQSVLYDNERSYALISDEYESQQRKDAFDPEYPVDLEVAQVWKSNAASVYYLEDDAFRAFLQSQGADPEPYFNAEKPLAAVLYQKWHVVGIDEKGLYNWIDVTFPPLKENVTELSFLPEAPAVDEYVSTQIKALGYQDSVIHNQKFDQLPNGRIVFRIYGQGCSTKPHEGGVYEFIPEGEIHEFLFLAVESVDEENQTVTRYYTYDPETDTVGKKIIVEEPGGLSTMYIGAQLQGLPFGIPNSAADAMWLSLLRPLSLHEDFEGMPALSLKTNNYLATKAMLDSLSENHHTIVYNDNLEAQFQTRQISQLIDLFAYSFVGIMLLICITNIFNIISTNILLRRRDTGMLRALGMTDRTIHAMMAGEYLSCGIRALCWSLPIGIFLMLAMKILLGNLINGGNEIPWNSVIIAVAGVIAVVGSGVIYALTRIRKDNPIEAIRMENI